MRVLIAEDDAVSLRVLEASLKKWGYEACVYRDGAEAWEALQVNDAPRLAVLDWVMPGIDGLEICRRLRKITPQSSPAESVTPYTYVLLLTARAQTEDIVAGMDAGADDYIAKPFHASELQVRLRAGQRILDLQDALVAAREKIALQARQDPLTGAWNRRGIFDLFTQEVARCHRRSCAVSLIMADLDHFKSINDNHGHPVGDVVLAEVADRIRAALRPYDALGRYGGEEFLVILPDCGSAGAYIVAERIRQGVCEKPLETDAGPLPATVSIGVATWAQGDSYTEQTLVQAADEALYRAKESGRNRVVVAD